jgi:hypothetical protein
MNIFEPVDLTETSMPEAGWTEDGSQFSPSFPLLYPIADFATYWDIQTSCWLVEFLICGCVLKLGTPKSTGSFSLSLFNDYIFSSFHKGITPSAPSRVPLPYKSMAKHRLVDHWDQCLAVSWLCRVVMPTINGTINGWVEGKKLQETTV